MSEKNLRHAVRDALKPAFVTQVENAVAMGTPDTFAAYDERAFWLELKFGEVIPARASTPVFKSLNRGLTVEQEATLFQMWQHYPGLSWILARIGKQFYVVEGNLSYAFNEMTLAQFDEKCRIELKELRRWLCQAK